MTSESNYDSVRKRAMEKSQSIFETPPGIPPTSVRKTVASETEILFHRDGFWWEIMVKEKFSYYRNTFLFSVFSHMKTEKKKNKKQKTQVTYKTPWDVSVNLWPWTPLWEILFQTINLIVHNCNNVRFIEIMTFMFQDM